MERKIGKTGIIIALLLTSMVSTINLSLAKEKNIYLDVENLTISSGPQPELISPGYDSNVYENIDLYATELTNVSIITSATFEYSSNGIDWFLIGTDTNGTYEVKSTECIGYDVGLWNVTWSLGNLTEGNYSVRVTMTDIYGQSGQDWVPVYVDPTPPIPTIIKPADYSSINGTITILASTTDENVAITMAEYLQINTTEDEFKKEVPLLNQHDYGRLGGADPNAPRTKDKDFVDLPDDKKQKKNDWDNNDCCGPTSAASSLKYFAQHGYPNLLKDPVTGNPITDKELVEGLATLADCKENEKCHPDSREDGTCVPRLAAAIAKWVNAHGGCLRAEIVTPSFDNYKKNLEECEDLIICTRTHFMTANSVKNKKNPDGNYTVDFMDPWTGTYNETSMRPDGNFVYPPITGNWVNPRRKDDDWIKVSPCPKPPKVGMPAVPPRAGALVQWAFIGATPMIGGFWPIPWNTINVSQNEYYLIRVSMMDANGRSGWSYVSVFVESSYDVKIINVDPSKIIIGQGYLMPINVTVKNQGLYAQGFNVVLCHDKLSTPNSTQRETFWGMGDVDRNGFVDSIDIKIIEVAFGSVPGDPNWNADADLNQDGVINARDISICAGNYGKDIWTYFEMSPPPIGKQAVILQNNTFTTLTFIWNTTGFAKGNYTIWAYATPVPGETDTSDNNFTDGWVIVAMVGDITGPNGWADGQVDIRDVALVSRLYGLTSSDSGYNPNCDIDNTGEIDIKDVAIVSRNYGRTNP